MRALTRAPTRRALAALREETLSWMDSELVLPAAGGAQIRQPPKQPPMPPKEPPTMRAEW